MYGGRSNMNDKVMCHQAICKELNSLYEKKNHDYGDAFHLSYLEEGMAMARIRLGDKLNRFKQLSKNPDSQAVNDESIRDTLIDLANYAIMTVLEMDCSNDEGTVDTAARILRMLYRGSTITVARVNGNYDMCSESCTICDICRFHERTETQYPCEACRHGDGHLEYFELDCRKAEVIK